MAKSNWCLMAFCYMFFFCLFGFWGFCCCFCLVGCFCFNEISVMNWLVFTFTLLSGKVQTGLLLRIALKCHNWDPKDQSAHSHLLFWKILTLHMRVCWFGRGEESIVGGEGVVWTWQWTRKKAFSWKLVPFIFGKHLPLTCFSLMKVENIKYWTSLILRSWTK